MKTIHIYIMAFAALALASCNMKDHGNYDYPDADEFFPVKIANFSEDFYDMELVPLEPLRYEPKFDLMDDYDRYEYKWYTYHRDGQYNTIVTILSEERILDLEELPLASGSYTLWFEVSDPKYGLRTDAKCSISVQPSPIGGTGIYIMKEVDGKTEVDYHKLNIVTEMPDEIPLYPNIISTVLHEEIEGRPVDMQYMSDNYYWEQFADDGSASTSREWGVWYILSEKDIVAVRTDFSIAYKRFDGHFYTQPEAVKPQVVKPLRYQNYYMMNNNQVYGVYTMSSGVGRFQQANTVGGLRASDAGLLNGNWYSLFFDELSGDFMYMMGFNASVTNATNEIKESTVLANKELITGRQVEPVIMLDGGGVSPIDRYITGTMILKHKTQPDTYYMTKSMSDGGSPFEWIRPIDPAADIVQQPYPVMSSSYMGDVIYYAKGNELWMYTDGGDTDTPAPLAQRQKRLATLGAGEKIVDIEMAMFNDQRPDWSIYNYSWITVTTNTPDGKYKFYAFENIGATADLKEEPVLVLSGEGEAVCHFHRFLRQN